MKESALLLLCKHGDSKGQRLLYEKYAATMLKTCQRYLKNQQDVHHVLNEGFLKVFKHIKTFQYKEEGLLAAWIKRIMINESLMLLRKQKQLMLVNMEQISFDLPVHIDHSTDAECILEIIKNLPFGYRTVFNLFVIEGYSHKEIGELLNISESSSRSQLTHARTKLKETLTKLGFTYE